MKLLFPLTILLAAVKLSALSSPPVVPGSPFNSGSAEVIWAAPTNDCPESLWVYTSVRQQFPLSVVSNLMWLGDFTQRDSKKSPVADEMRDKDALYYSNKERTRNLGIYPLAGYIEYNDETAQASMRESPRNIPSDEEAMKLALKYLRFVGIDHSQIARKPNSTDLRVYRMKGTRSYFDRKLGQRVVGAVDKRGVYFVRCIDGVEFTGLFSAGGAAFDFADDGKLSKLIVNWRNFQPHQLVTFPNSHQFVERIKLGRAIVIDPVPTGITKVTVKKVSPFYQGLSEVEKQPLLYPFADLELELETAQTNFYLRVTCPIVVVER